MEPSCLKNKNCLITFWNLGHFFMYTLIGYFCPNLFWSSLIFGIIWEYIEYMKWECEDYLDIVYNILGFFLGKYFSL